ncbi:TPA: hypothetical protein ACH3X2_008414 [Trebouxia sp. C0005]
MPEVHAGSVAKAPRRKPNGGVLGFLTKFMPTNYNMLIFRTMNRDMHHPNTNNDDVAFLFRNRLMPVRSCVNRCLPACLFAYKRVTEHPKHGSPGTANYIDARTTWFDQAVEGAIKVGLTQVVVIAAGFDSRAYRLHAPGMQFYEVDLPHASNIKQKLVQKVLPDTDKYPRPVFVGADLSKCTLQDALQGTSFDAAKPSLFICEGLVYYLPEEAVEQLVANVAGLAAPTSLFYFDFLHLDVLEGRTQAVGYANTAKMVDIKGEPFLSGIDPSPEFLSKKFAQYGMSVVTLLNPRDIMARMLPHLPQSVGKTQILPFYSFAAVQRDSSAQDAAGMANLAGTHYGTLPTGGLGAEHARHGI